MYNTAAAAADRFSNREYAIHLLAEMEHNRVAPDEISVNLRCRFRLPPSSMDVVAGKGKGGKGKGKGGKGKGKGGVGGGKKGKGGDG